MGSFASPCSLFCFYSFLEVEFTHLKFTHGLRVHLLTYDIFIHPQNDHNEVSEHTVTPECFLLLQATTYLLLVTVP